jgi:polar amino acid transport system permease protein
VAEVDRSPRSDDRRTNINITDGALIPEAGDKSVTFAWNIAFFGAIALVIILPVVWPKPYWDILKFVPDGLFNTFLITVCSIVPSLFIGLITGVGRISRNAFLNRLATLYVEVVRGIPLLVQLFYLYYGLSSLLRIQPFPASIMSISICYGAYMGEVFRAGILAVPRGQMEAALALGLTRGQALRKVILPQTIKLVLPPIGNEIIALLKDTSLVSVVSIPDLLRRGREYTSQHMNNSQTFSMIALVYLILTLLLSRIVGIMERRLGRSGRK